MKAPGLVPSLETRDRLVVLPEAKPKRRWLRVAGVILLAAWTAAVSGIGVYLWQRDAQIGVAFVRANHKSARLGDGEVHAGDSDFGLQKLLA